MKPTKSYTHDRVVLLLISASAFFTVVTVLVVAWQLGGARNEGYIVQYRPSLGLNAFQKGTAADILAFPVFAVITFVLHLLLSIKTYRIHKYFSIAVLGMSLLLSILALIISYSLLRLR
jgi:hypothetical protein